MTRFNKEQLLSALRAFFFSLEEQFFVWKNNFLPERMEDCQDFLDIAKDDLKDDERELLFNV